jgi:anti-sigma factor RsiW
VTATPMDCQDLVELITAYLDDALDEPTRRRFDEHLAECDPCVAYVEQFKTTVGSLASLQTDAPQQLNPDFTLRLLNAFRDWK